MRVKINQLIPVIFPPGAGGHFFYNLLTIHPDVMPMGKDQCMKKLFVDKNIDDSVARIKLTVPKDFSQWQDLEAHDYYIAPPKFDDPTSKADWLVYGDKFELEGDHHFFRKINKDWYRYGITVHDRSQFPMLDHINKHIGFDRFDQHVSNSRAKIPKIDYDYRKWDMPRHTPKVWVTDSDEFYYDWSKAKRWIKLTFEYLNLRISEEGMDAIDYLWHHYESVHSIP